MGRKTCIDQIERDLHGLELRKAGVAYADIAQALGYANASGAFKAVQRALDRAVFEAADHYRQLHLARLETLLQAHYQRAISTQRPDDKAVQTVLRILSREADLLGLDAPTRVAVSGDQILTDMAERAAELYDLDPDQIRAEAERILKEARGE